MNANIFKKKEILLLDFDGTIKKSDNIKGDCFVKVFGNKINNKIIKKIKLHHLNNLGMTRYDKLPIYLKWNGIKDSLDNIKKISSKFSKIVVKEVIRSNWVVGARKFIILNKKKKLILITATPKKEMVLILKKLGLFKYFYKIYGAPIKKENVVKKLINSYKIKREKFIYFGNTESDYFAAKKNNIDYVNIGKLKKIKTRYNSIRNFNVFNKFLI